MNQSNHQNQGSSNHSAAALLDLVPTQEVTHRAVRDGAWNRPGTWQNRQIPGTGDRVVIPKNRTVTYNRESGVALDWVRVDGKLKFANTKDTQLVLDTFVVAPTGELEIGNDKSPIRAQNSARIQFTAKGDLDSRNDPQLLGRGIITHGKVNIVGADKLDHVALKQDALKGDRVLVLDLPKTASRPKGWQVGDKLVLGGTSFNAKGRNGNNSKFRDEVLTITGIQGNRIKFTNDDIKRGDKRVLRFDHTRPNNIKKQVDLYVANISRNVSFETLNVKDVPNQARAHAMFMHDPNVTIKHAGFYGLGRTDKKKPIDDVGENVDGSQGTGTNPRGRYAFHIHKTGFDVNDGSVTVEGNAVVDSPGWGIVQHGSKGVFSDNVVFDVVGAGIVSEDGNESGWWIRNITIKTTGDGSLAVTPAELKNLQNYDIANQGEGYWMTGAAQIAMRGNIAVSAAGGGLNVFSKAFGVESARPVNSIPKRILSQKIQDALPGQVSQIAIENVPAQFLKGFQAYNSTNGVFFWQHLGNNDGQLTFNAPNLDPAHNLVTKFRDFKLWGILDRGVEFQYSTQIDLENGLIAGSAQSKGNFGIRTNGPSQKLGFKKLLIDGFREGITIPRNGRFGEDNPLVPSKLEKSVLRNNDIQLSERLSFQTDYDPTESFPDYFEIRDTTFLSAGSNKRPSVRQRVDPLGGLVFKFDASDSFDPDVPASREDSKKGIAAYGWDFNADGKIDDYGRVVRHRFNSPGRKNYILTIWDNQGKSTSLRQSFEAESVPYRNLFLDASFNARTKLIGESKFQGSTGAGLGWLTSGWAVNRQEGNGGALEVLNARKGAAQVIYDDKSRVGLQRLSLNVKRVDRDRKAGRVNVKLWGLNGEFEAAGWRTADNGPERVGALPFQRRLLLDETAVGGDKTFQKFNWTVNVGSTGYEFLILQVNAQQVQNGNGETLFIDNVNFASPGQPIAVIPANANPEALGSALDRLSGYPPIAQSALASDSPPRDASARFVPARNVQARNVQARNVQPKNQAMQMLEGTHHDNVLRGSGAKNWIQAGNGNDVLVGGRDSDVLMGGLGRDRFRWFQPEHGGDRIMDFNPLQDRLEIKGENFGLGSALGTLNPKSFALGTRALDGNDRLIYNPKTGNLSFDADGSQSGESVVLAKLVGKPDIQASHIRVL